MANLISLNIVSFENGILKISFMPFLNDFAEKMMFSRKYRRSIFIKSCDSCNAGRWDSETYLDNYYLTKYKNLTNDLYFKSIWVLQFKLHEKLGFFPLQYEINKTHIKALNYTLDFTSKDGWFNMVIDTNTKEV